MKTIITAVFFLLTLCAFSSTTPTDPITPEKPTSSPKAKSAVVFDSSEFAPIDDAYLQGATRYNNDLIRLQQDYRTGYLKFNLGAINGTITKVELQVRISTDSGNGTITVFNGSNSTWTENNLSTANAPTEGANLGSLGAAGSLHVYNLSIADPSIYSGNLSLILKHTGTNDLAYASSENASTSIRPKLIVTYTPNTGDTTAPTAPTLSSSAQTQTTVNLNWSGATDNVGVTGYKLFQDGTEIPNIGNVSNYQVSGLSAQTGYVFTVKALDLAGNESADSNTLSITTDSLPQSPSEAYNVGGAAESYNGTAFGADQYAVGGTPYTNASALVPELYKTERSGTAKNFSYNIPVANGNYDVKLHFAEIYWGATGGGTGGVGKRIFDVFVEGTRVLDNYDIFADVGTETPVVKTFSTTVTDGTLNLYFTSLTADGGIDQAKLSAYEIVPTGANTGGVWVSNGDDIYFSGGKVGIGTSSPDYALTVKGKTHAEEVRIDLAVPAPDYVFKNDYELLTLKEVQEFIDTYGHLPNIPSAIEMESQGVELGSMEMKLLEKIEELTLHLLAQRKRRAALAQTNKQLKNQLKKLTESIE